GGILLFALNSQSAAVLAAQFAERKMKKTYLALSDRKPSKKQGWIKGGMEKSRRGMWKLTRNMENIAVTQFFSIRISEKMRLFILEPHTGKTHQLRVAMKSLGSPILGTAYTEGQNPKLRSCMHGKYNLPINNKKSKLLHL
ncbi:pseudouridine synthase, partial [Aeromonas hydrophila]|uniref:pseudouridine synthase n=1 Tax=Aeromonas hydrophila TaxID=644 RepID=UPI003EC7CB6B